MTKRTRSRRWPKNWKEKLWRYRYGLLLAVIPLFFLVNWCYHAYRKPSETIGLLQGPFFKEPRQTWQAYGDLFIRYATDLITPELLAALAQAESRGNPIARTYWVWRWSTNPFKIYAPASSAVGLFQVTDGNFREARHYCVRDGKIHQDGPWYRWDSCWFNGWYNRLLPSHATELTAAYLHLQLAAILVRPAVPALSLEKKQELAALVHLCGPDRATAWIAHKFRALPAEKCGDHALRPYLAEVLMLRKTFSQLRATTPNRRFN